MIFITVSIPFWNLQRGFEILYPAYIITFHNLFLLFQLGRYEVAQRYYQKIAEYFKDEEKLEGEQAEMRNKVYLTAHLNIAMSYLKLQNDLEALHSCDEALKLDPQNEKGLFRRGTVSGLLSFQARCTTNIQHTFLDHQRLTRSPPFIYWLVSITKWSKLGEKNLKDKLQLVFILLLLLTWHCDAFYSTKCNTNSKVHV